MSDERDASIVSVHRSSLFVHRLIAMADPKEPPNYLYPLLLVASLAFVVTALAYAILPVLVEKAKDAGQDVPPSPFRDALNADGWKWLLYELAAMIVLGLASMGLDRWRRWRREKSRPAS
jgi:hypothetical protein